MQMDPQLYRPLTPAQMARDRALVRELAEITLSVIGSMHTRKMVIGLNDGSVDKRDYQMPLSEEPREEVTRDHHQGKHQKPQLDCIQCQHRYAQFRRRQEARMDVVVALGGRCEVCREPVLPRAARFVHRRGHRSTITQMFQWSYGELMEAARDYAIVCPKCSRAGGRKQVVGKERAYIAIGMAPKRKPRSDKGKPNPKRSSRRRHRDVLLRMRDAMVEMERQKA